MLVHLPTHCMLAYSLHAYSSLAYFDSFRSSTYTGLRIAFMLSCKCGESVNVWVCLSVSVEVSVFKGFSGRTLRNAFGKNCLHACAENASYR